MAPVVPIIDMSDFEARREEVMQQLMDAAEKIGFFQVGGHCSTPPCQGLCATFEVPLTIVRTEAHIDAKHCNTS